MTATQLKILRDNLLIQLNETRIATSLNTLRLGVLAAGFKLDEAEVEKELQYLVSKGLARPSTGVHSKGFKSFVITGEGTDYLEGEGLC